MDVEEGIGKLLVLSSFNVVGNALLAIVTLFVIVPYLIGLIPFHPVGVICTTVVFLFGATSIYIAIETLWNDLRE